MKIPKHWQNLKQDLNPLPSNFTAHSNNRTNNSLQVSNEKKLGSFRDEIDLETKTQFS